MTDTDRAQQVTAFRAAVDIVERDLLGVLEHHRRSGEADVVLASSLIELAGLAVGQLTINERGYAVQLIHELAHYVDQLHAFADTSGGTAH